MTRIVGLAAPFNTPNSYNETLRPGAFREWLEFVKDRTIVTPMLHGHERLVGRWTGLHEASDGLYADGLLDDEEVEQLVRGGKLNSLSVNYVTASPPSEQREARCTDPEKPVIGYRPLIVSMAALEEISIVDSPAFKEAKFHWSPV